MTWFDGLLVLVAASVVARCAQRRLAGAVLAVGGLVVWWLLNALLSGQPFVRLVLALVAALGLAALGYGISRREALRPRLAALLGGAGGAALAAVLVLALVSALPLEPSLSQPGRYHYPPLAFPSAVRDSALVGLGRAILVSESEGPRRLFYPDRPWAGAP